MKIGIIADIHANIYGLKAVLKKLKDADVILCAGDIIGYYTFVNEVFDELRKNKVRWIRGNLDNFMLSEAPNSKIIQESKKFTQKEIKKENLEKLKNAPEEMSLSIDNLKLIIFHETPWGKGYIYPDYGDFDRFKEVSADVIILGHTHYPMIRLVGKKTIINPGSCGQPRDFDSRASYAIFDTETQKAKIYRVNYDFKNVISKVKELKMDQALIDILMRAKEQK